MADHVPRIVGRFSNIGARSTMGKRANTVKGRTTCIGYSNCVYARVRKRMNKSRDRRNAATSKSTLSRYIYIYM